MGKYMRKSKGTGGVALMEVKVSNTHTQPSLGVRTRAKTLALQRLESSDNYSSAEGSGGGGGGGSFLQLRSRRLEKVTPIAFDGKRQKLSQKDVNLQLKSTSSRLSLKGSEEEEEKVKVFLDGEQLDEEIKVEDKDRGDCCCGGGDLGVEETSFGENVLEFDGRERTTRESTPCSLIRDADAMIRTPPGSSTRPSTTTISEPLLRNNRENSSVLCQIPTANEMEEFFSVAEELQQRNFIEKYNFDPVTDKPLPGRYEWVKLN